MTFNQGVYRANREENQRKTEGANELLSRHISPSSLQEIMGTIRLIALLFAPYFGQTSASRSAEEH